MNHFELIALTPPGFPDPSVAIAASRAGGLGLVDLEHIRDESLAFEAISKLASRAEGRCGIRVDTSAGELLERIITRIPEAINVIVLAPHKAEGWRENVELLRQKNRTVLSEVTSLEQAREAERACVDGFIAKGHEAGGWIGEETSLVLLQRLLASTSLPVWVHGGVGLHTVGACFAAGCAGVVLDSQLFLLAESHLPEPVKAAIARMDGSETVALGSELEAMCRVFYRPGLASVDELRQMAKSLGQMNGEKPRLEWRSAVESRLGWAAPEKSVWFVGQDAVFAAPLAERFRTVRALFEGLKQNIDSHIRTAQTLKPLDKGSPLARSHGTRYPIVQGPMTRVSDKATFAAQVADAGALPFLALALMSASEVEALLKETHRILGDRPWGVGILGFVPLDLRQQQLAVVRAYHPPFALIAGGRPDQALSLEQEGIATYLHVPSPGLLEMFLDNGARRFVFEGRECGGHVGPRSSFVLWNSMIDVLLKSLSPSELTACHVLFAGGIHDAVSASMVATMAAPLAEHEVRVGVLLGTAYLFTEQAVTSGAIVKGFQEAAMSCQRTVLLETGPGHATRCVETPYVTAFERERRRLVAEGKSAEEIRNALEDLNLGRLRIAAKGIARNPAYNQDATLARLVTIAPEEQRTQGMYMIGQVAVLRDRTCTMSELHEDVSVKGTARVEAIRMSQTADRRVAPKEHSTGLAIVGMACLLPKANDLSAFWHNVLNKVDAITEVPQDRWDWRRYYDPDPKARDKIYSKWGGFVDPVPFDPMHYGMPPNTLPSIEPLQLMTLNVVEKALEDAGYNHRPFPRERTSVILGVGGGSGDLGQQYAVRSNLPMLFNDPSGELFSQLPEWTEDSFAGILLNVVAGRVANRFDLGGVNYTVDAACASSLAAIYLAARELEAGTSDVVIAGGADTVQNPFAYLCFSKTHALSPRGRCRTFDEGADGIVISEGVAVIVLKRLADAEKNGDRIYAVLKAVAGSSDGRDRGLTAPRPEGQIRALERAYEKAEISPATVGLIEAHGTGTVAGDRAEIESLSRVFNSAHASKEACAIGSVKSMIGHTKCTAGVAGLIKVALALHHKVLPPTINVDKPNPALKDSPFYVNVEARPWLNGAGQESRRGGVSSFGFGGTNFHAVIEEYIESNPTATLPDWPAELMLWAGTSSQELLDGLELLETALSEGATPALRDLSFTLWEHARGRIPSNGRGRLWLAIVTSSLEDLRQKITWAKNKLAAGEAQINDPRGIYFTDGPRAYEGKIAFLFPGQGSQYVDMLRDLTIHFSEVREQFEIADRVLAKRFSKHLSAFAFPPPRFGPEEEQKCQQALTQTHVAQPAMGAADLALFHLLRTLGVEPAMVAGHSYGEYVALCAAGVFGTEQLYEISEARGRFIADAAGENAGTMAAVEAGREAVYGLLRSLKDVWLANLNSPKQTIISGTHAGVQEVTKHLESQGMRVRPMAVACAFHSPLVAPARSRLEQFLSTQEFRSPKLAVFSNSSAAQYTSDPKAILDLLANHLIRPVEFQSQIEAMYEAGARVFVEVGPRNVLSALVQQILGSRSHVAIPCDIPGRPGLVQLAHLLAQLATQGVPLQLDRLFQGRSVRRLNLSALLDETKQKPLPPTTWWVTGSKARPSQATAVEEPATPRFSAQRTTSIPDRDNSKQVDESVSLKTPLKDVLTPSQPQNGLASSSASVPPRQVVAENLPNASSLADPDVTNVMIQYQKLMNRFLETQKETMLAFLQGSSKAGLSSQPPIKLPAQPKEPKVQSGQVAGPHAMGSESVGVVAIETSEKPVMQQRLPDSADKEQLTHQLLRIVGDRTGYPPEMLDLDLNMEADLGIDSIKRVEILGAFQRACFPSGQPKGQEAMEKLTGIKTLRGIVDLIHGSLQSFSEVAEKEPPSEQAEIVSAPAVTRDQEELTQQLLRIVGDRTGYPPEMLDLDLNMEADLGIDSIKRVEILGAFQHACFPSGQPKGQEAMEKLTGIKTFRGIVDWVQTMMNSNTQDPSPPVNKRNGARGGIEEVAKVASEIRETSQQTEVPRFTIATSEAPLNSGFPPLAGVFLVTNDGAGLAEAVVEKLQGSGALPVLLEVAGDYASVKNQVERARQEKGSIRGLIHLAPLKKGKSFEEMNLREWREKIALEVKSLFYLASAAGADLQACSTQERAYVMAAVNLYSGTGRMMSPSHGGVSGLVKTLAVEWPDVRCRVVDLEPNPDRATLADLLLREMGSQDKEVEVSYRDSRRHVLRAKTAPWVESASGLGIDSDSVVLITGGARGITAEIACELAVRYRPHLVLVGRSSPPASEESPETIGLSSPQELKRALVEQRRRVGDGVTLAEIEAAYQRLVRDREMRRTFAAIRESGASLNYYSVDVRDEKAFGRVLREIYETQGRIDAVVHGAGIIEDKLLVDKAPDSFDRVFDTKADSAFILARNLRAESLKVFVLFSSVAGCFGNRGQSDYGAANEVLNQIALCLDGQWPGRVVSINWGPWEKAGMVSKEVQQQFAKRAVQLISPVGGRKAFDQEIRFGRKGETIIILGNGPWKDVLHPQPKLVPSTLSLVSKASIKSSIGSAFEMALTLDPRDHYLQDHRLDDKPVFPAAMAVELMAEAVQRGWPDLEIVGIRSMRVLQGIVLDEDRREIHVSARPQTDPGHESLGLEVDVEISESIGRGRPSYRATVQLADRLPSPPPFNFKPFSSLQPFPMEVKEAYSRWLFHGPFFEGIGQIEGINENGIVALISSCPPGKCLSGNGQPGRWIIDPVLMDCGFQLAILWERYHHDMTPLPSRFTSYRRFATVSDSNVRCFLHAKATNAGHTLLTDIIFTDGSGRILGLLEEMEFSCSRSLNRLAGYLSGERLCRN